VGRTSILLGDETKKHVWILLMDRRTQAEKLLARFWSSLLPSDPDRREWFSLSDNKGKLEAAMRGEGEWLLCTSAAYRTYCPRGSSRSVTEIDSYLFEEILNKGRFNAAVFNKLW
jgi:hypothetical protein